MVYAVYAKRIVLKLTSSQTKDGTRARNLSQMAMGDEGPVRDVDMDRRRAGNKGNFLLDDRIANNG